MTECGKHGRPESRLPTLPTLFGNPLGFPHHHGLDDWPNSKNKSEMQKAAAKTTQGSVTDVPGPKRNECPGTLIPQEGLVTGPARHAELHSGR